jgi:uncharacterized protein YqgC (DUF456 family)
MRRSLAPFTALEPLVHTRSWADFITTTSGFRFSVHTGAIGAFLGAIAGIFFLPLGLILGPVIGAFAFEALFAKQEFRQAATSGVGSAVGTVSSLVVKIIVGVVMVVWFLMDVLFVG